MACKVHVAPTGKDVVLLQGMRFYDVEEALQVPLLLYLPPAARAPREIPFRRDVRVRQPSAAAGSPLNWYSICFNKA
jgi:hypothetical protein